MCDDVDRYISLYTAMPCERLDRGDRFSDCEGFEGVYSLMRSRDARMPVGNPFSGTSPRQLPRTWLQGENTPLLMGNKNTQDPLL